MAVTKAEIAQWMIDEIESRGFLYQADAAQWIEDKFGAEWIYENENGNPAINTGVLTAFRKMKSELITWNNSDKCWNDH